MCSVKVRIQGLAHTRLAGTQLHFHPHKPNFDVDSLSSTYVCVEKRNIIKLFMNKNASVLSRWPEVIAMNMGGIGNSSRKIPKIWLYDQEWGFNGLTVKGRGEAGVKILSVIFISVTLAI